MKTSIHIFRPWDINWYPRTMVRDTDGPKFGVKKLKSNEISCFSFTVIFKFAQHAHLYSKV